MFQAVSQGVEAMSCPHNISAPRRPSCKALCVDKRCWAPERSAAACRGHPLLDRGCLAEKASPAWPAGSAGATAYQQRHAARCYSRSQSITIHLSLRRRRLRWALQFFRTSDGLIGSVLGVAATLRMLPHVVSSLGSQMAVGRSVRASARPHIDTCMQEWMHECMFWPGRSDTFCWSAQRPRDRGPRRCLSSRRSWQDPGWAPHSHCSHTAFACL